MSEPLAQENDMIPEEQKQIVRQGYDRLSYAYRADHTPDDYEDYAAWVRILAERLPEHSPVLDIGCGCGLPASGFVTFVVHYEHL